MSAVAGDVVERAGGTVVEVGALYARGAELVRGHVRKGVAAPEVVIEDACQAAWSRLLYHRHRVSRECALAWVTATAIREALKLSRRDHRELSLEGLADQAGDLRLTRTSPSADELAEARLRLELLDALPERQQRLLWLQGLGFDYREMAGRTGGSVRTVERQLAKARRRLTMMECTGETE
jgi:RNA polymerase sigma factor (sigma-70 family)